MQPSAPGRGVSGAPKSLNPPSANNPRRTIDSHSSSSAFISGEAPSHPPAISDEVSTSALWYYSQPGGPVDNGKGTQALTSSSSSSMIGPTSTFYNGDDNAFERDGASQYQQWIESYNQQPQQQQQLAFSSAYRQDMQGRPGPAAQQEIPVQNPYSFMQSQYTSASTMSQYGGSTSATITQAGLDSTTFPTHVGDMYSNFYPDMLSMNGSSASSPDQTQSYHTATPDSSLHSYTNSPDPLYQQQQQQQSQPPQQHQRFAQQAQNPLAHTASRQATQPQSNPSRFQQPSMRYAPQRNAPEHGAHASPSNPASTHASSLSPPPQPQWSNSEIVYQTKLPPALPSNHQFVPPSTNFSQATAQAGPSSQPKPPTTSAPLKRPTAALDDSPGANANSNASGSVSAEKLSAKRKRAKKNEGPTEWSSYGNDGDGMSDSDSDEDDGSGLGMSGRIGVGLGGLGVVGRGKREKGSRLPGACTHCKKLKMKCDFPKHENTCKRCKTGGHVCIVEGRRPRTAPNKREYLLAQIRQKDAIIESLLKQLHNPYIATPLSIASYRMATSPSDHNNRNVLAWLDRLQSSVRDAGKKAGPQAFLDLRNVDGDEESDQESESKRTQGQVYETAKDDATTVVDGDDSSQDADKLQTSLPDTHVPLGLIADLSLSNSKANRKKDAKEARISEEDLNDDNVGVANETYFMPGPATDLGIRATLIEQHSAPEILVHGLVKPEDVDKLFQIFYERVNPFISLLDPVLHTPDSTFARCPFLFTVICAISSRYYAEKSEIYPIAMHFAKHSAANALIDGWKSVELCQAYILMSIYAVPARRWEEDRSWLYTGLAIRIATDLNLHQVSTAKPQSEKQEREILNKTRVWMTCFNLDRSTATQFGKPSTIKEDFVLRNSKDWYRKSQYNLKYDVHLCGYSALLQIVAKFHDEVFSDPTSPTGLNKKVDFRTVTLTHNDHLTNYHKEWSKRFKDDSDPDDPTCAVRCLLLPFLVGYSRLVMFSFGFQQAYQRGFQDGDSLFITTCMDAAKSVLENMIDGLAPSGYMRYAPDGHFVFASFASAFLLKLLRPEFSSFLVKEQENEIFDLIGRLIQTLSSPKIAIDDRHTPKLYARFLAGLLSRHRRDGATVGRLQTNPAPPSSPTNSNSQTGPSSQGSRPGNGPSPGQGFGQGSVMSNQVMDTPIYMPEATFAASTGQISFGTDYEMSYGAGGFSDEEMLATMQAIKNPAWWQTMMMPGFSWPEGSPSPPANHTNNSAYPSNLHPAAIPPGFGMFHGVQAIM